MIAAKTFKLNPDNKCYVLNESLGPEEKSPSSIVESPATPEMDEGEVILEAARACPVQAIRLYEDDGKEIVL